MDELDAVMAGRLRAALEDRGLRREDMAREMTQLGFRWTGNTVTQVITGRRGLSALELAGLCAALGVALADFVGSAGDVKLPNHDAPFPISDVAEAIRSGGGNWPARGALRQVLGPVQREFEEVRTKAARRLGVTPEQIDKAAMHLWGRPIGAERDHRFDTSDLDFNAPENRRTLQARRGHATRTLIDELRAYFADRQDLP